VSLECEAPLDSALKVTDQPQEASFSDVVSGDNVINIPLFQRSYRWNGKNFDEMWEDLQEVLDDRAKSQFLGVLVLVSQTRQIGRPAVFDVVDGQQRLSTCYLTVFAMAYVAAQNGKASWAVEVAQTYLLLRPFSDNPYNTKLVPAFADRQQFANLWNRFRTLPALAAEGVWPPQYHPSPPTPSGKDTGAMTRQFERIVGKLKRLYQQGDLEAFEKLLSVLVSSLSFVQISLRDPTAAPKIFERLNARGERITTGDLVRNEVFARVSQDPNMAQSVFAHSWEPFISKFSSADVDLEKLLFPYGLILNPTVTKADLFQALRKHWANLPTPQAVIADMDQYGDALIALEKGVAPADWSGALKKAIRRLHELNVPSSMYALILRLIRETKAGTLPEPDCIGILHLLENFLFRRAIAGYEPTGLHAVFKGMWKELADNSLPVNAASVAARIAQRPTVPWPSDYEFSEAVKSGDLYNRRVAKYALRQYEESCNGETPKDDFVIEHIIPRTPTDVWTNLFGDSYPQVLHTWANLLPLTASMNPSVGQDPFEDKREEYAGSMFSSTRQLADAYVTWGPADLEHRAQVLSEWALGRWPGRPGASLGL
jgi:hypothetical protein